MLIIIAKATRAATITVRLNLRIRRSYACIESYSMMYNSIVQLPRAQMIARPCGAAI
jgi:hypothetical protein